MLLCLLQPVTRAAPRIFLNPQFGETQPSRFRKQSPGPWVRGKSGMTRSQVTPQGPPGSADGGPAAHLERGELVHQGVPDRLDLRRDDGQHRSIDPVELVEAAPSPTLSKAGEDLPDGLERTRSGQGCSSLTWWAAHMGTASTLQRTPPEGRGSAGWPPTHRSFWQDFRGPSWPAPTHRT